MTERFPTPLQLRSYTPKQSRRGGYDRADTNALLDRVCEAYEGLWRRSQGLLEELEKLDASGGDRNGVEHRLRQTLLTAELAAEKYKEQARRQADATLKKARAKADAIVAEAEAARRALEAENGRLLEREAESRATYETFLHDALERLQAEVERLTPAEQNGNGHKAPVSAPSPAPAGRS